MVSLLLVIIYLAFISLGLPDSVMGSAWPSMRSEMNVPISYMGIIAMIISFGTIISSLFSDRLVKRIGSGRVVFFSTLLTAIALFGFSISKSFYLLILWAIPYGLGAGSIDATLNNYVAINYKASHMNFLHAFWGLGASISPYIMGYALTKGLTWSKGYFIVFIVQMAISLVLFLSLPLWKRTIKEEDKTNQSGIKDAIKIKGAIFVMLSFFFYCALEQIGCQWASSYLVYSKEFTKESAAFFASLFYLGITFGRLISVFVATKLNDKRIIRIGIIISIIGIILLVIPIKNIYFVLTGLVIIGLGCAPIFPALIHSTPVRFDLKYSQALIGLEMAFAYIAATFMPALFGFLSRIFGTNLYPFFLLTFALFVLFLTELSNIVIKKENKNIKENHIVEQD